MNNLKNVLTIRTGIEDFFRDEINQEAIKNKFETSRDRLIWNFLKVNISSADNIVPLKDLLHELERAILVETMILCKGCQKEAATLLNLKPTTLFEKLRKHNITLDG